MHNLYGDSRLHLIPRSGIREVMELSAERELSGQPVLHLEVGQPHFQTPSHIIDAAVFAAANGQTRYTPNLGSAALREAIASRTSLRTGVNVSRDQVAVTHGAIGALHIAVMAVVRPGGSVLVPDPGFPNYRALVALAGGKSKSYRVDLDADGEIDLGHLSELIDPTVQAIIINSPSNPTGQVLSRKNLAELSKIAEQNNITLISDEIYEDIVFGKAHASALGIAGGKCIIVSGVSKSYSMTGWRIGWLVGDSSLIRLLPSIIESTTACPNSVAQAAAVAAINGPQDSVRDMKMSYAKNAEIASKLLAEAGLLASTPSGAFYALANISKSGLSPKEFVQSLLLQRGVAVAPGCAFSVFESNFVRISFATDEGVLIQGIQAIVAHVDELVA